MAEIDVVTNEDDGYVTHFFAVCMGKYHGPYKTYEMAETMAKESGFEMFSIEKRTKRKDFNPVRY